MERTALPWSRLSRRAFLAAGLALPASLRALAGGSIRLSCLPVSFFSEITSGRMQLSEWFDFAAELGLDGVECGPLLVKPLGPVSAIEFRRLAEARGLAVSNYTSYSDFTNPDAAAREREVQAMFANVRIARELGAASIRTLAGQQRPGVSVDQGVRWVVESVRRVAAEAERLGLHLNMENHTKASTWADFDFAIKSEVFLRILDELKDDPVGVQFDTANPLVAGEDALALFEKVRSRIGYLHVNDSREPGKFEFVVVGTGAAPIREIIARLKKQGYAGWVGVEEFSRTGKEGFRQAVRYTREALEA